MERRFVWKKSSLSNIELQSQNLQRQNINVWRVWDLHVGYNCSTSLFSALEYRKHCFRFVPKFLTSERRLASLILFCLKNAWTMLWLKMKHRLLFMFPRANASPRSGDYSLSLQPACSTVDRFLDANSCSPCLRTGKEPIKLISTKDTL